MTQDTRMQEARAYLSHQAQKGMAEMAAMMARTAGECADALADINDEQASFKEGEEWSIKEIVGHMLSSGAAVNREIANLVKGEQTQPPGRTGVTAGGDHPIAELRERMAALWDETRRLVGSLPAEATPQGTWEHPFFGQLNFKEWIAFQRLHALDHVQQIEKVKTHADYPAAGA